jgi:hypothetical protein
MINLAGADNADKVIREELDELKQLLKNFRPPSLGAL